MLITVDRDDSAILVMLTVRQLNPSAHVVVAVREDDNASLLRQSGANAVVTSSEAVGRLLGLSAVSPTSERSSRICCPARKVSRWGSGR